jgi:hypothetical protein
MNLFRSEEHVKAWSGFKEGTEAGIVPLDELGRIFSSKLFKNRLQPGYLGKIGDYKNQLAQTLANLGPFWQKSSKA